MSMFKWSYLDISCNNLMRTGFFSQKRDNFWLIFAALPKLHPITSTLLATDSTADLLWLYIKFILPSYSHLILFSFLYPFNIRSASYNVLLWKVRFNELFNAMSSWGTKWCLLTASGSFTLGWAPVLCAKEIRAGMPMIMVLIHLLWATGTSTLCFTLTTLVLKHSFYYQRQYSPWWTEKYLQHQCTDIAMWELCHELEVGRPSMMLLQCEAADS